MTELLTLKENNLEKNNNNYEVDDGDKKPFRIRAKWIMLTYESHIDKTHYINWWKQNDNPNATIRIAFGTGTHTDGSFDKKHYNHSHMVITFEQKPDIKTNKKFRFPNERNIEQWNEHMGLMEDGTPYPFYEELIPHISIIKTKKYIANALRYLHKNENEVDYENEANSYDISPIQEISECKTAFEALEKYAVDEENLLKPTFVMPIINIKKLGIKPPKIPKYYPIGWQLQLIKEIIEGVPDDRHIIWIHDPSGCTGKTQLIKYLVRTNPQDNAFIVGMQSTKDLSTYIENLITNGWTGKTLLINLPKMVEDWRIGAQLEQLTDGLLSSSKYSGVPIDFDCEHLIVFANWLPNQDIEISGDRFKTYKIVKDTNNEDLTELKNNLSPTEMENRIKNTKLIHIQQQNTI